MSYDAFESSPDRGSPITLYEFKVGPAAIDAFRYTDADEEVGFDPDSDDPETTGPKVFERTAVDRTELRSDGSLSKASMTITVPASNPVAQLYQFYPPSYVVTVKVFEGHFLDRDREFIQIFGGRVLNVQTEGVKAELLCEPASTSMRRPGLRRNYQRQCPLVLYGPECKAIKTPYQFNFISYDHNILVGEPNPIAPLFLDGIPFQGGWVQWTDPETKRTQIRTILLVEPTSLSRATFTLLGPIPAEFENFTAFKGCAHTESACIDWHDNVLNYGGQLWIPFKNPLGTVSTYF